MSSEISASLSIVLHVVDLLEELGVRYHLGGSFASAIHGVPRQTMDADLVVDLGAANVVALVDRLRGLFYVDLEVAQEAVASRGTFNAIHLETGFKIDFFAKGTGDFDDIELDRSELTQITADPPRSAYVKTAEDIIPRKLQWFRSGGGVSDRQWRDVLGVLTAVGRDLDRDYLHQWASNLGLSRKSLRAVERPIFSSRRHECHPPPMCRGRVDGNSPPAATSG